MDDFADEFDNTLEDSERSLNMDKSSKNGTRESRGGATATASNGHSNGQSNGQPKNVPVHTVRLGGIKVAVWRNQTTNGPMHNSTIVRSYKNQQGEWAESQSFSRDDLLVAAKALDLAHTYIVETEAAARSQQQQSEAE